MHENFWFDTSLYKTHDKVNGVNIPIIYNDEGENKADCLPRDDMGISIPIGYTLYRYMSTDTDAGFLFDNLTDWVSLAFYGLDYVEALLVGRDMLERNDFPMVTSHVVVKLLLHISNNNFTVRLMNDMNKSRGVGVSGNEHKHT